MRSLLRPLRITALAGLSAVFVILLASPAFATAVLQQASPSPGAVLTTVPTTITLRYSENVTFSADAVRLYNSDGRRVDTGSMSHPSGTTIRVALRTPLADGAYEVTWRVVSSDTNPVHGSFTFQVGLIANATAPNVTGLAQSLAAQQRGDQIVGVVYGLVRGALYAGLALLLGTVAFGAFIWPPALRLRRVAHLAWLGWGLTLFATVAMILLQGIYGAGLGFGALFRSDLIRGVLGTQFGHLSILRLVILAAAIPLLRRGLGTGADATVAGSAKLLVCGLAVALAITPALSGHAHTGTNSTLAVPSDVIHILAMSIWLGGLAVLTYAVFTGRHVADLHEVVHRFSRVAVACVAALIVTGTLQAWLLVGSVNALRTTPYGHILSVKLVVVLALVVLSALSRQIISYLFLPEASHADAHPMPIVAGGADDDPPSPNGHGDETDDDWEFDEEYELRRLRRSVFAEVVLLVAVLAVSVLLVNATPAKVAAAQHGNGVAAVTLKSSRVWLDFYVIPGIAPSANDVHLTAILPSGAPENLDDLTATLEFPSRHVSALMIPLRHLGPGHYLAPGFTIPFAGTWRVTTQVILTDSTHLTLSDNITFP